MKHMEKNGAVSSPIIAIESPVCRLGRMSVILAIIL